MSGTQHSAEAAAPTTPGSRGCDLAACVDGWASGLVNAANTVGLTVAVARHGETLLARGYGLSDRESHVLTRDATVYRIGSLTKQLVAAAIVHLADRGALSLEDSVGAWLPETGAWGLDAQIGDLLRHTAGTARDVPGLAALIASARRVGDEHRAAALVAAATPEFAPRSAWRYSNGGYLLAGLVIERATGQPALKYVVDLLRSCGLAATDDAGSADGHAAAVGYDAIPDSLPVVAEALNLAAVGTSGALRSTALDLLTWDHTVATGMVLSPERRALIGESTRLQDGTEVGYGLGVFVGRLGGFRELAHRGDIPGAAAFKAYYPDVGVSVVVLSNTLGAPAAALGRRVARCVLGIPAPLPVVEPVSPADRIKVAGTYRDGRSVVDITDNGTGLIARTPDGIEHLGRNGNGELISASNPDLLFAFDVSRGNAARRLTVVGPALRFEGCRTTS